MEVGNQGPANVLGTKGLLARLPSEPMGGKMVTTS